MVCKDFRTMVVLFTKENSFKPTLKVLKKTIPKKMTDLFCYKSLEVRFKNLPTYLDGWFVYNMQEEFYNRQKVPYICPNGLIFIFFEIVSVIGCRRSELPPCK